MAPTPRTAVVPRTSTAKETVKKIDDAEEVPAYSQENVQLNMRIIYYSRTFLSIVGGVIAGVLGLTGISGFLFYFLIMMLASGELLPRQSLMCTHTSIHGIVFSSMASGKACCLLFYSGRLHMILYTFFETKYNSMFLQ